MKGGDAYVGTKVKIPPEFVLPPPPSLQSEAVCGIVTIAYHILWNLPKHATRCSTKGRYRRLGTFLTKRFPCFFVISLDSAPVFCNSME